MKMFKCLAIALSIFFSSLSAAMNNDSPQTLVSIQTGWGGEGLYIKAQNKPSLCSADSYFISPSAPMYKDIYAALLAAYQANGKVILNYDGCGTDGNASLKAVALVR